MRWLRKEKKQPSPCCWTGLGIGPLVLVKGEAKLLSPPWTLACGSIDLYMEEPFGSFEATVSPVFRSNCPTNSIRILNTVWSFAKSNCYLIVFFDPTWSSLRLNSSLELWRSKRWPQVYAWPLMLCTFVTQVSWRHLERWV